MSIITSETCMNLFKTRMNLMQCSRYAFNVSNITGKILSMVWKKRNVEKTYFTALSRFIWFYRQYMYNLLFARPPSKHNIVKENPFVLFLVVKSDCKFLRHDQKKQKKRAAYNSTFPLLLLLLLALLLHSVVKLH